MANDAGDVSTARAWEIDAAMSVLHAHGYLVPEAIRALDSDISILHKPGIGILSTLNLDGPVLNALTAIPSIRKHPHYLSRIASHPNTTAHTLRLLAALAVLNTPAVEGAAALSALGQFPERILKNPNSGSDAIRVLLQDVPGTARSAFLEGHTRNPDLAEPIIDAAHRDIDLLTRCAADRVTVGGWDNLYIHPVPIVAEIWAPSVHDPYEGRLRNRDLLHANYPAQVTALAVHMLAGPLTGMERDAVVRTLANPHGPLWEHLAPVDRSALLTEVALA